MKQIVPGLFTFTGLMVGRVYLIEDPDGLTLVDASIPPAATKVLRQLATAGRRPDEVKRILITHAHPDHVGALPALQQATGAQVIASAADRPVVEGKASAPLPPREALSGVARLVRPADAPLPGTPVDREVQDGEVLAGVMGGLTALATPGHTPGHLAFWQPERRILLCGDVLMRLPWLRLPFAVFTTDMAENVRSIRRVAELEPSLVCFGHGQPLTHNTAQALRT
ncbi:MAG: MBL fold metallo-hydrolase, partial [Chloroflexi bacterium]|nr:MBL fold metallo-hydrolase [Chloroflexota bacterium]